MTEIRIESLSVEELQSLVQKAIREEVQNVVSSEINRALTTPDEDKLLIRAEAMELLGIRSRSTIITMEKAGYLDPIRLAGNRVSYRLKDIKEFIERKRA